MATRISVGGQNSSDIGKTMTQAFLRWGSLLALLIIWQLSIGWFSPQDTKSSYRVTEFIMAYNSRHITG